MDILRIIVFSIASIIILFILTKLMGNKELSQINMFDYITSITIGSVAAEMATGLDQPAYLPATAIIIYGVFAIGISYVTQKSLKARKIITGMPIILMDNGTIYRANFSKARIEISDFLVMCRTQGYFNLDQIQTAIMEYNGSLSILPKSNDKPLTPKDMNLSIAQEYVLTNVILDGILLKENLKLSNHDKKWLDDNLKLQGYENYKNIFLAICDQQSNLKVYPMVNHEVKIDRFE